MHFPYISNNHIWARIKAKRNSTLITHRSGRRPGAWATSGSELAVCTGAIALVIKEVTTTLSVHLQGIYLLIYPKEIGP